MKQFELLKAFSLPTNLRTMKSEGARGGKGRKKKTDDDDDDDDDMDDDGDKDEDKFEDVESEKEADVKETRHERAMRRAQEQEVMEQRRIKLKTEATEGHGILLRSAKVDDSHAKPLYEPWIRKSKITSDAPSRTFRGQNLVTFHTWEWASCTGSSRAHNLRIVICSAIEEHCIILNYRQVLLSDADGGACFLCNLMEERTERYHIIVCMPPRQAKLGETRVQMRSATRASVPLQWADALTLPESNIASFNLTEELETHHHDVLQVRQCAELQRIVTTIELQQIAWQDTTNTATKGDRPPINPKVHKCITSLCDVCSSSCIII